MGQACAKFFICTFSFNPPTVVEGGYHDYPHEEDTEGQRSSEPAHTQTPSEQQSWDLTPGVNPILLTAMLNTVPQTG